MVTNTIKFSEFAAANLATTSNMSVGFGGGANYKTPFVVSWSTATRPVTTANLIGFNTDLSQYEFWNGSAWIQLAAGGSGSVNPGTANQLAYYATNGSAVSGLITLNNAVLTTDASGNLTWENTGQIPGTSTNNNAAAGNIGEFISSVRLFASAIPLTTLTPANVTTISLTAGDWDVTGNVAIFTSTGGNNMSAGIGWISLTSATLPDVAFTMGMSGAAALSGVNAPVPGLRVSIAAPTTVYLSVRAQFAPGGVSACGGIYARRVR